MCFVPFISFSQPNPPFPHFLRISATYSCSPPQRIFFSESFGLGILYHSVNCVFCTVFGSVMSLEVSGRHFEEETKKMGGKGESEQDWNGPEGSEFGFVDAHQVSPSCRWNFCVRFHGTDMLIPDTLSAFKKPPRVPIYIPRETPIPNSRIYWTYAPSSAMTVTFIAGTATALAFWEDEPTRATFPVGTRTVTNALLFHDHQCCSNFFFLCLCKIALMGENTEFRPSSDGVTGYDMEKIYEPDAHLELRPQQF